MLTRAARKRKNANLTEHLADKTVDLDVSSTIVSSEHSVNSENSAQKEKISMVSFSFDSIPDKVDKRFLVDNFADF